MPLFSKETGCYAVPGGTGPDEFIMVPRCDVTGASFNFTRNGDVVTTYMMMGPPDLDMAEFVGFLVPVDCAVGNDTSPMAIIGTISYAMGGEVRSHQSVSIPPPLSPSFTHGLVLLPSRPQQFDFSTEYLADAFTLPPPGSEFQDVVNITVTDTFFAGGNINGGDLMFDYTGYGYPLFDREGVQGNVALVTGSCDSET